MTSEYSCDKLNYITYNLVWSCPLTLAVHNCRLSVRLHFRKNSAFRFDQIVLWWEPTYYHSSVSRYKKLLCWNSFKSSNIRQIGFIGRLDYQKGVDIILSAIPELVQDDVQFVRHLMYNFLRILHCLSLSYTSALFGC